MKTEEEFYGNFADAAERDWSSEGTDAPPVATHVRLAAASKDNAMNRRPALNAAMERLLDETDKAQRSADLIRVGILPLGTNSLMERHFEEVKRGLPVNADFKAFIESDDRAFRKQMRLKLALGALAAVIAVTLWSGVLAGFDWFEIGIAIALSLCITTIASLRCHQAKEAEEYVQTEMELKEALQHPEVPDEVFEFVIEHQAVLSARFIDSLKVCGLRRYAHPAKAAYVEDYRHGCLARREWGRNREFEFTILAIW